MKLIILDWETHADKFHTFFMFEDILSGRNEKTDVSVYKDPRLIPDEIDLSDFDMMIYPRPYCFENILSCISEKGFKGTLVIEKLMTTNVDMIDQIIDSMKPANVITFHLRLYSPSFESLEKGEKHFVKWPLFTNCGVHPVYNILANFYDEVYCKWHTFPTFQYCWREKEELYFKFVEDLELIIVNDNNCSMNVILDGAEVKWPNYMSGMQRFFHDVFDKSLDISANIEYEKKIVKLLSQIEKENIRCEI